jgi:cell envelope opacity-associated protein A
MKKRGRKLIKYLEVTKWERLSNLQNKKSPPMGRRKTIKRTRAFFLNLEKAGKRISKITEASVRGKRDIQS